MAWPGRRMTMMSQKQAAVILGVEVGASRSTVQRAFRAIAREVHPDAGNGDEAARLQQAMDARDTLLSARDLQNRRIVNGPRPWPPTGGSWPPQSHAATAAGDDDDNEPVRFVAPPPSTPSEADQRDETDSRDFADRLRDASERGSNWIVAVTLVAILVLFLIVGAILTVGALFGSSPAPKTETKASGCVAITDLGLSEVDCADRDAQRIVSRSNSITSCEPGQNTVIVDQTTWCLEFAAS